MNRKYGKQAIYEGEKNPRGLKHGEGKLVWPNGCEYEGEWVNDQANGMGILKLLNGEVYEGEFKKNMSHGYGVFTDCKGGR